MITPAVLRLRVKRLPSLPTTVMELSQAVADDRCTVDKVLSILEKDPPLSATILRLANSAFYSADAEITNLRQAVMRLGFEAVTSLGTGAAVIKRFQTGAHLDAVNLWKHSVAVGLVAKGICKRLRRTGLVETAFIVGLLHDIGKFALDFCFPEEYTPVVENLQEGKLQAFETENQILGITHAEVGAMLAELWRFPVELQDAIRQHHDETIEAYLPNLIQLCDLLVRTRIPSCPADDRLCFSLEEVPSFQIVFAEPKARGELDMERLIFEIDDELEHATQFVELAFKS